jgi:hypothetical protein
VFDSFSQRPLSVCGLSSFPVSPEPRLTLDKQKQASNRSHTCIRRFFVGDTAGVKPGFSTPVLLDPCEENRSYLCCAVQRRPHFKAKSDPSSQKTSNRRMPISQTAQHVPAMDVQPEIQDPSTIADALDCTKLLAKVRQLKKEVAAAQERREARTAD